MARDGESLNGSDQPLSTGSNAGGWVGALGGVIAVVGWLLPTYGNRPGTGLSFAAGGDEEWLLRLVFACAAVLLGFVHHRGDLRTKVVVGTVLVGMSTHWGLHILRLVLGSYYRNNVAIGWYLTSMGFLLMLVGGLMSVIKNTRPLSGIS